MIQSNLLTLKDYGLSVVEMCELPQVSLGSTDYLHTQIFVKIVASVTLVALAIPLYEILNVTNARTLIQINV